VSLSNIVEGFASHIQMVGWWDGGMVGWWDGGMVGWWDGERRSGSLEILTKLPRVGRRIKIVELPLFRVLYSYKVRICH
jgi:hypothetical protein